ncbi:MAG: alpha-hydroxy-acid oxidizing protein, partial [Candidatus Alkanophagales archaeon]
LGRLFRNWGIPTPVGIVECSSLPLPIIATGGIRSGLDIAKSLALGADVCSAALPFVKPAMRGAEEVRRVLECMAEELRVTMFLCGCGSIDELKRAEVVVTGRTREMLEQRGFLRRVQKVREK